MKKTYLSVAVVLALTASITLQSCVGSFALTNKVLSWNRQVGDKFVNEIVFVAMWILPVYELCGLADLFILNSVEFWSGENPVTAETKIIDGKDAKYMLQSDATGYTITNLNDKSVTRLNFDAKEKSWSVERDGEEHFLFAYVDDTHVRTVAPDGGTTIVELSQQGVWAYKQLANDNIRYAAR
ncbi:MAG: DUF3332 domain-containing protein [Muribaculaceae bacterium]|nr:DUF3332 domain-containing protein [Muribaculaceae bacterium]